MLANSTGKNILVTGGVGFIGTHLVRRLRGMGHRVRVVDNLSPQVHDKSENEIREANPEIEYVFGDIRDQDALMRAIEGMQVVFHLAAETGVGQSMYEISRYTDTNITGTARLLEAIARPDSTVEKIILTSSRAVYGEGKYFCQSCGIVYPEGRTRNQLAEGNWEPTCPSCAGTTTPMPTGEDSPCKLTSIYGITKYTQEQMVRNFSRTYRIPFAIFRLQNVIGPDQSPRNPYTGVLSVFATRALNGSHIEVFEDGNESRDFIDVRDVVDILAQTVDSDVCDGQILNVGTGIRTSILELATYARDALRSDTRIVISGRYRVGDVRHAWADVGKIRTLVGYSPQYNVRNSIREYIQWLTSLDRPPDFSERAVDELKMRGLA